MATRTSYLNLIKPDYTDAADIADINANMDTLDNTIQGLDETGSKSLTAHNNATDAHQPILNAIKEITGMSSYDIAPSKTIAAIIPLLGLGGIVAQKLETNGYVKFASGLTLQWGTVTATTGGVNSEKISEAIVTFTFPIAFTSAPWAILTGAMETADVRLENASIANKTPTNVQLYLNALGYPNVQLGSFVLAIGK